MLQNQYGYTHLYHHWLNMDVQERKLLNCWILLVLLSNVRAKKMIMHFVVELS